MYGTRAGYKDSDRIIGSDKFTVGDKRYIVSTVDLGVNHNISGFGPPLYWETMVFKWLPDGSMGNPMFQDRYSSKSDAEIGHKNIVEQIKAGNILMLYNTDEDDD